METKEMEFLLRKELWLNHGHGESLYGDDGQMQCHACIVWDYKNSELNLLVTQVYEIRLINVIRLINATP